VLLFSSLLLLRSSARARAHRLRYRARASVGLGTCDIHTLRETCVLLCRVGVLSRVVARRRVVAPVVGVKTRLYPSPFGSSLHSPLPYAAPRLWLSLERQWQRAVWIHLDYIHILYF
jgi:hypothetical protein